MTDTSGVGSTTQTQNQTQASINSSLASVANNYQTFLSLLTTQLKNQDPLSPLDTNQFTQQLTQMTGVEQQLLGNQLLQQLVSQQSGVGQAANMIGKVITAPDPGSTADATLPPITGVVTSIEVVKGQTVLNIGDQQVPLSSVTGIAENPNNPLAGLFGS